MVTSIVRALSYVNLASDDFVAKQRNILITLTDAGNAQSTYDLQVDIALPTGGLENKAPVIDGTPTGVQQVADTGILSPFANMALSDPNGDRLTVTVSFDKTKGTLIPQAGGAYDAGTGIYTVEGSALYVTLALKALQFAPQDRAGAVGQGEETTFEVTVSDGAQSSPANVRVNSSYRGSPAVAASSFQRQDRRTRRRWHACRHTQRAGWQWSDRRIFAGWRWRCSLRNHRQRTPGEERRRSRLRAEAILHLYDPRDCRRALQRSGCYDQRERCRSREYGWQRDQRPDRRRCGPRHIGGGLGNDTIFGGLGNDVLTGNGGRDFFVFNTKPNKSSNVDRVSDFSAKDDTIWLDNAVFTKIGETGTEARPAKLKADMFWTGKAAHDSSDRIIYDKATGALYYDADGTGRSAQVKIATLTKNQKVSVSDFFAI